MQPTPAGWPRISACLFYTEPLVAIDWLCAAFGFEVRLKCLSDTGELEHSELVYGDGLIMVGGSQRPGGAGQAFRSRQFSPQELQGGNTQSLCLFVDDADAHCAHARSHGAEITVEPRTDDYGPEYWADRTYGALDCEGHHWWFMQRMREPRVSPG